MKEALNFIDEGIIGVEDRPTLAALSRKRMNLTELPFNTMSDEAKEELSYYQSKYDMDYDELGFCVVIPTYNNQASDRYLRNLKSILMQNYTNYHIIVFNDGSTDNTGKLIEDYLKDQSRLPSSKYQIIHNPQQLYAMANLRDAAMNYCKEEEIFFVVDGDDELIGRQVFKLFNSIYQKYDVWFVYTNFINSNGGFGFSQAYPLSVIQQN